jgi:formylglycine-generating enzyme required for sulfatase activity
VASGVLPGVRGRLANFSKPCEQQAVPANQGFPTARGTITNSIGMEFVPIPAGDFLMGSPEDCPFGDAENEELAHRVRISRPFLLGMHQVTQSQYERVTGENPSFFNGLDLLVEHLTWSEARLFCELLSDLPEERAAGRQYRLPTEAEWEYACRAGTTTTFNTGDTLEPHQARFATTNRSSPKPTAPVGSYPPNAWGLFDMHGNVWEWTSDWFSANYFRDSPVDDPQGPETGTHHTLRGGSASVQAHECRSSCRGEAAEDSPEDPPAGRFAILGDFGVRVVCQQSMSPLEQR